MILESGSKELFERMIENVLKKADNMNFKSIAIPGPNGAVCKMPMVKTCQTILSVIKTFFDAQSDKGSLKSIVVIHSSQHVVRSLFFMSNVVFGSRTSLIDSASSILDEDMPVDNSSQHVESTVQGNVLYFIFYL